MKLSVSLRFSRFWTVGRTTWVGDQLIARPLPVHKHRKTHTYTQTLNIHVLSGIRIHDPGFRASEDNACLRPLGYRDRRRLIKHGEFFTSSFIGIQDTLEVKHRPWPTEGPVVFSPGSRSGLLVSRALCCVDALLFIAPLYLAQPFSSSCRMR
jgi:hypothetical protein